MSNTYIKPLDGVRGMAILLVMFFHYNLISFDTIFNGLSSAIKLGQSGVTLFFVLSGFLITRILLSAKNYDGFFKNFYVKRLLRISPLYYLFLFIYYFALPFIGITQQSSFSDQLPFFLYYQNVAVTFNWNWYGPLHYWSLAVEEHFYFIWPFVIYYCSLKNVYKVIYIIIILAILSRILLLINGYGVFYFTLCRMDAIAIGSIIALKEFESNGDLKVNWTKQLTIFTLLILGSIGLYFEFAGKSNIYIQIIKDIPYYYFFYLLIISIVATNANKVQAVIKKIFMNRILLYTGKISFGLYVFHSMCYDIIHKMQIQNIALSLIMCFAFSFIIATISFYVFEMQFLKLKKFF
jgi:peptidoglycan/LPS O-acetylase OafA/YrhL